MICLNIKNINNDLKITKNSNRSKNIPTYIYRYITLYIHIHILYTYVVHILKWIDFAKFHMVTITTSVFPEKDQLQRPSI